MNDELERIWNEARVAKSQQCAGIFPEGLRENYGKP
jgi:hypothetical protein